MKYYLVLIFCCLSLLVKAQKATVDNQSRQSDSSVVLFTDYLIAKGAFDPTHMVFLTVTDYSLGMNAMSLDFVGYQMGNSIFKNFASSVCFDIADSTTGKSYRGLVLESQVFVNRIDYFNFSYPTYFKTTIEELFQKVLKVHYPKCELDAGNFVKDENGDYIGEMKLEYKTLEREGCLVSDYYSTIERDNYSVLGKSHGLEAVVVFYHGASEEYFVKGHCIGDQFEMYDIHNVLIHKGVISRYLGE